MHPSLAAIGRKAQYFSRVLWEIQSSLATCQTFTKILLFNTVVSTQHLALRLGSLCLYIEPTTALTWHNSQDHTNYLLGLPDIDIWREDKQHFGPPSTCSGVTLSHHSELCSVILLRVSSLELSNPFLSMLFQFCWMGTTYLPPFTSKEGHQAASPQRPFWIEERELNLTLPPRILVLKF